MADDDLDWQRLADHIRAELDRRGWTQADLAERTGVHLNTINTLLRRRHAGRMPTVIPKIERALGWDVGQARAILDGWTRATGKGYTLGSFSRATTVHPNPYRLDEPPRPPGAREVADLVRKVESLRDAIEHLPLADADRRRFLAQLAEYEDALTDALDRTSAAEDIQDAG